MNKYTKAIPAVRASKLYKSLCRVFRKQDHGELLRQLVWAYVDYEGDRDFMNLGTQYVSCAFTWGVTPQGFDFWQSVYIAARGADTQP